MQSRRFLVLILERTLQQAVSVGVTSLQEMSKGELDEDYGDLARLGIRPRVGSDWVRTGALKTVVGGRRVFGVP